MNNTQNGQFTEWWLTNKSNIMHKKGKKFRLSVIIKYIELKVLNAWHGWKQHFQYLHKSLRHDNNFSKKIFFHQSDMKTRITIQSVYTLILESNKILS